MLKQSEAFQQRNFNFEVSSDDVRRDKCIVWNNYLLQDRFSESPIESTLKRNTLLSLLLKILQVFSFGPFEQENFAILLILLVNFRIIDLQLSQRLISKQIISR